MAFYDRFSSAYQAAKSFYESEAFPGARESSDFLERLRQHLEAAESRAEGIAWLKKETQSIFAPESIADYKLPLALFEYFFRVNAWEEGFEMLNNCFDNISDPSIRLELEMTVKRHFDPNWEKGEFEVLEFEPTVWDWLEEETERQ